MLVFSGEIQSLKLSPSWEAWSSLKRIKVLLWTKFVFDSHDMGQRLDPRSLGVSCVCMMLAMHVLRRTIHLSCSRLMREYHKGCKTYWNFLIPEAEPLEYLLILTYRAWYDSHPVESKMVEDSIRICSLLALLDNSYQ
jgi:hypothetical protein